MVRASSRLLFLLTNPVAPRHHRPIAIFRVARLHSPAFSLPTPLTAARNHALHISTSSSLIPINFSQSFYSRATNDHTHFPANDYQASPSHPWPEWSRLLESLSYAGYFNWSSNIEDEFVANQNLSMEFVSAANACLAFARDRPDILGWLSRKDIELLINDGYPYLFKNAHETERRMRSFLQAEGSNEARSVDLMKYILSYASNPIIYPERNIREATESSVRNLLQHMANLNSRRQEQIPRILGPNTTMKKGDWICPKCSFMNFARNTKCLECEQPKPPGNPIPYERPQNYQNAPHSFTTNNNNSNYVQLQDTNKEEKVERWFKKIKELHSVTTSNTHVNNNKKTEIPFPSKPHQQQNPTTFPPPFVPFPSDHISKKDNLGMGNLEPKSSFENNMRSEGMGLGKSLEGSEVRERDGLDMSEEAKAERWFRRVAQIKDISELSEIPDEDFPAIMPMRKGVNRFVVSKRKTPLERRLTSPQYRKNLRVMSSERNRDGDDDE
ncbi:hypothetical protein LXL04_016224 [Taraxacum kok-saghyz]